MGVHECRALFTDPYLHLLEHRMVLNTRKEDPHGICSVVQEGDSCTIQLLGQFMDVCLQLCKGCENGKEDCLDMSNELINHPQEKSNCTLKSFMFQRRKSSKYEASRKKKRN